MEKVVPAGAAVSGASAAGKARRPRAALALYQPPRRE